MSEGRVTKLEQPYHTALTAGEIRALLEGYPDETSVYLDGGDDFSGGHSIEVCPEVPV